MFSCESCFPSTECCIFIFLFDSDPHKLTCKKETVLLTATVGPQTDVKLTAGRQQESPPHLPTLTPPLRLFHFGPDMGENSPPFVWKTSKDRGPRS